MYMSQCEWKKKWARTNFKIINRGVGIRSSGNYIAAEEKVVNCEKLYCEWLPLIKLHDPLITTTLWELHYQSSYSHITLQDGHLLWWAPIHKVAWPFYHVALQDHVTSQSHYFFTTTVPMTTRLSRVVTYLERLHTEMSNNALIMWSCKVTWKTKTIISPLPDCL